VELLLFIITISFACFLQGIIGFGFALVATPLALIYLEKETVVSSMLIVSLALNGFLVKKIRRPIDSRLVIPLFLASLIGMPIGVWVLKTISMDLMKILVGSLAIVFTLILYFTKSRLPKNNLLSITAGFISGLLNTSTSMSGPPVVLFLASQDLSRNKFRKTLAAFSFLMAIVAIALLANSQVLTFGRAGFALTSLPFVLLAGFLGNKVAAKVSKKLFMLLALGVVLLSGFYGIFSGLK